MSMFSPVCTYKNRCRNSYYVMPLYRYYLYVHTKIGAETVNGLSYDCTFLLYVHTKIGAETVVMPCCAAMFALYVHTKIGAETVNSVI